MTGDGTDNSMDDTTGDGDAQYRSAPSSGAPPIGAEEEEQAETIIAKALSAIESGQQMDAALGDMIAGLPTHLQEYIKRRVRERAEKISAKRQQEALEHQHKMQDKKKQGKDSALKIFSMAIAARLIGAQALERITSVLRSRPDIKQAVLQAGDALNRNGVVPDSRAVSEEELGRIAPSAAQSKQQDQTRGV